MSFAILATKCSDAIRFKIFSRMFFIVVAKKKRRSMGSGVVTVAY